MFVHYSSLILTSRWPRRRGPWWAPCSSPPWCRSPGACSARCRLPRRCPSPCRRGRCLGFETGRLRYWSYPPMYRLFCVSFRLTHPNLWGIFHWHVQLPGTVMHNGLWQWCFYLCKIVVWKKDLVSQMSRIEQSKRFWFCNLPCFLSTCDSFNIRVSKDIFTFNIACIHPSSSIHSQPLINLFLENSRDDLPSFAGCAQAGAARRGAGATGATGAVLDGWRVRGQESKAEISSWDIGVFGVQSSW